MKTPRPGAPRVMLVSLFAAFCASALGAVSAPQPVSVPPGLPELPWLAEAAPDASRLGPLGEIAGADGQPVAWLRGAWNTEALWLHVEVADAHHVAPPDAGSLWWADSVEIGIDAAGDAAEGFPDDTRGPIGRDDMKFIFGLVAEGARGATRLGLSRPEAEALTDKVRIERSEADGGRTRYAVKLPWAFFGVVPGSRPTIGLDVQVNDRTPGVREMAAHRWRTGLNNDFEAAKLARVALAAPPAPFAAADWGDTLVWDAGDTNTLAVGLHADGPTTLNIEIDGAGSSVILPGASGWRHYRVATPAGRDDAKLRVRIADGEPVEASQTVASELQERLQARVAELLASDGHHRIFRRHVESVGALAADDWERVRAKRDEEKTRSLASLRYYRELLNGLHADAGTWEAFLDGRRSLVIAFRSKHDGTLQYYMFGLPRDWDETRAYPLFFELHGAGDTHPLNGLASRLGVTGRVQSLRGYEAPKVYAEMDRSGYWVYPWGRGNSGYRGVGRIDILEAYDDVHELVNIDPARRYLYGFSMGAGGTYAVGMRTPSRWAAASAFAGGSGGGEPESSVPDNWALLPLKILCGTEDARALRGYHAILEEMGRRGLRIEARTIEGLGHRYLIPLQKEMNDWMKTHERRRPAKFVFATDDNLTNECWGVRLELPGLEPREEARAEVEIADRTVRIRARGTRRITLDFSEPDGLGLAGGSEVVVVLNNQEAYRGSSGAPVTLDVPLGGE